eukprot:TRINITY_DN35949_c0_g1_i1.p1 TRINITY_DN35949_c0_g1~~TRINITY_DN35949_c0_g1_i1.p1  ORF type:complete len:402 (+),score=58.74 TRINITY_DN35949_c0_g1_i1:78-1283(+)
MRCASSVAVLLILRAQEAQLVGGSSEVAENEKAPVVRLSNGLQLPLLGLGCSSGLRKNHVLSALRLGYRHLDTAQAYQWGYHEDEVGQAVAESKVPRSEVVVQSKIHPADLGFEATHRAFQISLQRLGGSYIDSMLIHKPKCWPGACDKEPNGTWQESWQALQELHQAGKVHAIGICDVDDGILDELLKMDQKPHIIQNWMDPFHQDVHLRERCKKEGILYQGYSTLGPQWVHFRGHKENPVLNNPTLRSIARRHNATVAQVVIRWATRHGVAVLPASRQAQRQGSNLKSFFFELDASEMASIDALDGTLDGAAADDLSVTVSFDNPGTSALTVFWMAEDGSEHLVGEMAPGGILVQRTYHGHTFRFKHQNSHLKDIKIDANQGHDQRQRVSEPEGSSPEL